MVRASCADRSFWHTVGFNFHSNDEFAAFGLARPFSAGAWLAARAVMTVYLLMLLIWSGSTYDRRGKGDYWPIYLTHWSLTLELVYFGLATACTAFFFKYQPSDETVLLPQIRRLIKWTWCFQSFMGPISFLVFILFWSLVYHGHADALTAQVHGANFLLMAIDFMLSAAPFRFAHVWCSYLYASTYLIFSVAYFVAGGRNADGETYIYAALDYSKSTVAIQLVLIFVLAVPFAHCFLYSIKWIGAQVFGNVAFEQNTDLTQLLHRIQTPTHSDERYPLRV